MFVDFAAKPLNSKSTWRSTNRSTEITSNATQTDHINYDDFSGMVIKITEKETQTEHKDKTLNLLQNYNNVSLAKFLAKSESVMSTELLKNIKSSAFDGYTVRSDDQVDEVSCLHTLTHNQREDGLASGQIAWNKTGTVIGMAGNLIKLGVRTRDISVHGRFLQEKLITCLTTIAFHPESPSIVAGGTHQGEIIVWNMNEKDDPVVMSSKQNENSHQDPVTKLVSTGMDGRILIWSPQQHELKLSRPKCGGQLSTANIPPQMLEAFENRKAFTLDTALAITSISGFKEDSTTFVVGTEPGFIFKCNFAAFLGVSSESGGKKETRLTLGNPIQSGFTPISHIGAVTGLAASLLSRNFVLSCGIDGVIRILHKLRPRGCLAAFQPSTTTSPLTTVQWSPHKATVFAACTRDGMLYFYNLMQNKHLPVLSIPSTSLSETNGSAAAALSFVFNPIIPGIVSVADAEGFVRVFRIPNTLWECDGREEAFLQKYFAAETDRGQKLFKNGN
ncbi:WD repeat-containing protein 34 [Physocladia obscura]|uniref:WD repeat-containing protein 34 n=1 Tax=Physocladia obscura TaxID=109957 RepID=A0AAD5XD84_9FUNG|nr:WD repeat-containing protein 34 [Physocladia obscura]